MSELETDITRLAESVLGERLCEVSDADETLGKLKSGAGPFSITLLWGDSGERQSLVLHEWTDGEVLLFDPTHTLSDQESEQGIGMVRVAENTVRQWFQEKEAVALIPEG